ncbi:hypothetical protein TWF730_008940 [Orbilia blumenaviensis]|uniref:Uncharacterized protein n=1 Tax=Orbilia blumenaviensis TaxID=1796055 RepID=A0AAV9UXK0_9PEZI
MGASLSILTTNHQDQMFSILSESLHSFAAQVKTARQLQHHQSSNPDPSSQKVLYGPEGGSEPPQTIEELRYHFEATRTAWKTFEGGVEWLLEDHWEELAGKKWSIENIVEGVLAVLKEDVYGKKKVVKGRELEELIGRLRDVQM